MSIELDSNELDAKPDMNVRATIDKEVFVRSIIVIAIALAAGGCSLLGQIDFNGYALDTNKIYLTRADVVSVSARETYRYACVERPLLCVQRGVDFECHCP